ncbi:MAG: PadR family transcriptional regulator [Lachnospiraceae bacterium]|nr:PadR family transcriptional regulator [Lachnospiraceae bacterium]
MNINEWKSQLKRGTLEFCILLMINKKPCYGYEIINELDTWPILAAKESTIYPLLRRLLKDGFLSSFWQETTEGLPARKYYTITAEGKAYLAAMSEEWNNLLTAIAGIRGE